MSCACHGASGKVVRMVSPYEQCVTCAKKHVVKAWNLYNEFTYTEDNMDTITGQLRMAADHIMYRYSNVAHMCRDLAILLEQGRFEDAAGGWEPLLTSIRQIYNTEYPEYADALTAAAATSIDTNN